MALILEIPTLRESVADREWIFRLGHDLEDQLHAGAELVFRFERCKSLRPSAVAILGGIARLAQSRGCKVTFDWTTCSTGLQGYLRGNGFTETFGGVSIAGMGHAIPYREDSKPDPDGIVNYLQQSWLGRGWMNISPRLMQAIVGRVWEIYANAFDHGHSEVPVITCGQHYANRKELSLTVVDLGVGIPANVGDYLKIPSVRPDSALKWAFQRGTSTKVGARGIGLDLLKEFVKLNDGKLECFSGGGAACVSKTEETFLIAPAPFRGTLVTITLRCEDRLYYQFASEAAPQMPLF